MQWHTDQDAEQALVRLCGDPSWLVKRYAAWALGIARKRDNSVRAALDKLAKENAPQEKDGYGVKVEKELVLEAVKTSLATLGFVGTNEPASKQ